MCPRCSYQENGKLNRSPKRKPSAPIQKTLSQVPVTDLTAEGKGLARIDGKVIFIEGALPGEVVDVRLSKSTRQFDEGSVSRLIQTSEQRQTPFCSHYDECGGCQLQHLPITLQHQAKEQGLRHKLRKTLTNGEAIAWLTGPEQGYRRRARLSVFVTQGQTCIGFRAQSSNRIVDIEQCPVLTLSLQGCLPLLRAQIIEQQIAGKIGHIELLEDDLGVSVIVRLSRPLASEQRDSLEQWARQQDILLYWQEPEQDRISQHQEHSYPVAGQKIGFHPQDFIQVNGVINDDMVDQAMTWLAPSANDVVLDLFCGAGNFSLPLAQRSLKVYAVEGLESLIAAGRQNAVRAGLDNLEFIAADLTQPVGKWLQQAGVTKVLLDPPRAGAWEFLPSLVKLKAKQILYVSCNAATLARDAEYLVDHGYQVVRVSLMDMFPHTSHVETMMLLQRK